jgi:DNA replication protein DnaC
MDLVYIAERIIGIQQKRKVRLIDEYVESVVYESAPVPISYYFMPELFNKLHFGEEVTPERFILFDDWGREYSEPFALSRFEILIETLYARESSLVITTNLTKNEFIERPGWARITDRVREICSIIEIPGQSMRHR